MYGSNTLTGPVASPLKTLALESFGGVDFSSNPALVDIRRSPDAKNMVADSRFFPVKRTGWQRMNATQLGAIHGLHRLALADGAAVMLIHAGSCLYRREGDGSFTQLAADMAEAPSASFAAGGRLYLLDGENYRVYGDFSATETPDWQLKLVREGAFLPTTVVGRAPAGGGSAAQSPNLLTGGRCNAFSADGTACYHLDCTGLDADAVTATVAGSALEEGTGFTVDRAAGTVTFLSPPAADGGTDSVRITFSKTEAGAAGQIDHCTICADFAGSDDTRIFLSGNRSAPNYDWCSGSYDPTYFPADGCTRIGLDANPIRGYVKQFDSQIIIKAGNGQDASQYLRSWEKGAAGQPDFPVRQGAAGLGALSSRGFAILEDQPLLLTAQGVYASVGTGVAGQRLLQLRSELINQRLLAEPALADAVMTAWDGRLYLAVGGHCYLADSRQTYTARTGEKQYEWYYWDNIPACCFLAYEGHLWFGTDDGWVCRFSLPGETGAYLDGTDAIEAWWTTPYLNFGSWSRYKTIEEVLVVPLPYTRSSVTLTGTTETDFDREILRENIDLFDFANLDFARFSFLTTQTPLSLASGWKDRKIVLFQLKIANAEPGEAFGFLAAEIGYKNGGKVK